MSNRSEKLAAIRRDAHKAAERLEELAQGLAQHDFSNLSFDELILLRALTWKAYGHQELLDVAVLETGGRNWRPPAHAAEPGELREADLDRLLPAEKEAYLALVGPIVMTNEDGVP